MAMAWIWSGMVVLSLIFGLFTGNLSAVSAAALTVYDMCKAVQKDMEITDVRLCRKTGGKSGDYEKEW